MATTLKIEINDDRIQAKLNDVIQKASDPRKVMAGIATELANQTEKNFAAGGMPAWHPLAASTIKERTRRGAWPGQILQDSGALAGSITPESGSDYAQISTNNMDYAAIHQYGGVIHHNAYSVLKHIMDNGKRRAVSGGTRPAFDTVMHARPFMPVTDDGKLTESALDAVMRILNTNFDDEP
jgi:phage virion morphogenesis protein